MRDHYRTLAARAEHRIKVERSEFLGIAFPVSGEESFFAELARDRENALRRHASLLGVSAIQ